MKRFSLALGAALAALIGMGAGLGAYLWLRPAAPPPLATRLPPDAIGGLELGEPAPAFSLPDLTETPRHSREWRGKVTVVNFWATWCAPCRREIPLLIELQRRYGDQGLQLVGIAVNDEPDQVQAFSDSMGINYPVLVGEQTVTVNEQYGNQRGLLPFTAIVDRQGVLAFRKLGEVKAEQVEKIIRQLL